MQLPWCRSKSKFITLSSFIQLYCIVSIHLCIASCSAHQSEALPVRETQREESRCIALSKTIGILFLHNITDILECILVHRYNTVHRFNQSINQSINNL